jgi:hypothetical protein
VSSDAPLCVDAARLDGIHQRAAVALVLVRVRLSEVSDREVKAGPTGPRFGRGRYSSITSITS